jgi:hypothetical protein
MPRGKTQKSLDLIDACFTILEEIQPATVRAVCYQLFIRSLIDSMEVRHTKRVSKQLVDAREAGQIPWEWIVDETRDAERQHTGWENPEDFMQTVMWSYKRDRWAMQPLAIEVWSEKGTVRGTLQPVLREFGVTFRVMHGYGSATTLHEVAQDTRDNPKPLHVFYIGDWDPSGLHMSEVDLPTRLERYGGALTLERLALTEEDTRSDTLPSFAAATKTTDTRYQWFVRDYGRQCWEVDALSPPILRARVEAAIRDLLDPDAWSRAETTERAEKASMQTFFRTWKSIRGLSRHRRLAFSPFSLKGDPMAPWYAAPDPHAPDALLRLGCNAYRLSSTPEPHAIWDDRGLVWMVPCPMPTAGRGYNGGRYCAFHLPLVNKPDNRQLRGWFQP